MNEIQQNTINRTSKRVTVQHQNVAVDINFKRIEKYTFPLITYEQLQAKGTRKIVLSNIKLDDVTLGTCISLPVSQDTIQIISFYINEDYRNRGIGKQLLKSVISKIKDSKFEQIQLYYKSFWQNAASWESILKHAGYEISTTGTEYIKVNNLMDLKSSALMRMNWPSDHFQIVPINRKKVGQLEGWLSLTGMNDVPSDVRPGKHIYNICTSCSLLLLINNQIAGWIISDQISEDTIQVGSLYILPKYSKEYKHLGKKLITELIKRNTEPYKVFFGIRDSNSFMKRFVARELGNSAHAYYQKQAILRLKIV